MIRETLLMVFFIIVLYYVGTVVETYYKLKKYNIGFRNKIQYFGVPIQLFMFHIKLAYNERKDLKKSWYILKYGFVKYNIALRFVIEMMLEGVAQYEATGESALVSKGRKEQSELITTRKKKPISDFFKDFINILSLQTTKSTYEDVLLAR